MVALQNAAALAGLSISAAALAWAAASDVRRYLIPNRACLAVAGAYLTGLAWMTPAAWLAGLAVGVVALVLGAALFARGLVGGGDVKLAAAIALWAGPSGLSDFTLGTALSGALLGAFMLSPLRRLMPRAPGAAPTQGAAQPMPFGAPLAIGGGLVLVQHLTATL